VNIDGLFIRWPARTQQRINEAGESVSFADNNVSVFAQLGLVELSLE